jgi:hypothetical protein
MKVGFLLNCSYAPYHKWLHREFLKLPNLAQEIAPLLSRGFGQERERATTAAQIFSKYLEAISSLGYRPIGRAEEQPHINHADQLLYRYARGIQETILNPAIKDLNIYVEVSPPTSRPTWGWFVFERRADF